MAGQPPSPAEFPLTVQLVTMVVSLKLNSPPPTPAELPLTVQLVSVIELLLPPKLPP